MLNNSIGSINFNFFISLHSNALKIILSEGIEWLKELPYSISIPKFKAVVVHAGRVPNTTLEEQKPIDFVTMRNIAEESSSGVYEVTESCTDGCSWASKWTDEDWHVYFGHDAKRGLQLYPHATGLDTGVCYGECITLLLTSELVIESK